MERLLNISTHPGEPEMFDDDWQKAKVFLDDKGFDGFELYPVGDYPCERIPNEIVTGLHMRFFVILAPIWRGDNRRLVEIFGDLQTAHMFYGGCDAQWIADFYTKQLDLAHSLGCDYVVFHPVHCELEYIYNWEFPWKLSDTLDMCAEVLNAATEKSRYKGLLLFENLWWPGSFRLDSPREYDYLLSRVNYPRCGITLDTGHLLNKNPLLKNEREATDYMLKCVHNLGELKKEIHTIHLTRSLSGEYILKTQGAKPPVNGHKSFWEKFSSARKHVGRIDQHDPFETDAVSELIEEIEPDNVVFEFTFNSMEQWIYKIDTQKNALKSCLWPAT